MDTIAHISLNNTIKHIKDKAGQEMLAPEELSLTSAHAYSAGDLFRYNGKLYKVINPIAIDDAITINTNCIEVTIAEELAEKVEKVSNATSGNFASLDSNGNLVDSGHKHTDYLTSHQAIPVTDVQVNGTSIISSGVANVPLASTLTPGVARVDASYGISIGTAGLVAVVSASSNQAKLGTETYKPITPSIQNASTFYGLAKAAGDTTQASSSNVVGTYTDTAKSKIQSMLGISSMLAPVETDYTADKAYAVGDLFTLDGKLYKATAAIEQDGTIAPGTNCTETTVASSAGLKDVQVNGTTVVSSGVANIPIASSGAPGVVKINSNGLQINNGLLTTDSAVVADTKTGTNTYAPITPSVEDGAAFYGLAKAAGDGTQSLSSNAVGTYTDGAKTAIREMVDAAHKNIVVIQDTTPPDLDTKIWIDDTATSSVQIPTVNEMNTAIGNLVVVQDATPTSSETKIWIPETASGAVTVPTVDEMNSALSDYVTKSNSVFNDTISGGRKTGTTVGQYSFAFGYEVEANNSFSHSEGAMTVASGSGSHAEGVATKAIGNATHAEGYNTSTKGAYSHAEANGSVAYGQSSHAEGDHTLAVGYNSHSEGVGTLALGNNAHAEGYCLAANIRLTGTANTTQYTFTVPSNNWEIEINDIIYYSTMVKYVKVTEVNNDNNVVTVNESFGDALSNTNVLIYRYYAGNNAHSENGQTMASGNYSHAQGKYTIANTSIEDVSGCYNVKTNIYPAWVANTSYTVGDRITKETNSYECNTANNDSTWNVEKWTLLQYNGLYSTVVGNGLDEEHRANSYALDWRGNGHYAGDVYVGVNADSTGGTKLAKVSDIAVNDVQVNGTSILSNGVANVPLASHTSSSQTPGVVKVGYYTYGLYLAGGELRLNIGYESTIKSNGSGAFAPINMQHAMAFYGLARAAGDTTQAQSENAIGTYTNDAKSAIRTMIDAGTPLDVQINSSSIVSSGVANIPVANASNYGVIKVENYTWGVWMEGGVLKINRANDAEIKAQSSNYVPITPAIQHTATFYGLAKAAGDTTQASSSNAIGNYTNEAKTAIQTMLGVENGVSFIETISDTDVTISGEPNTRYMCGEVSTISITPPNAGIISVIFTSGTSATILSLPNTVKLPAWFDKTDLETDTIYEIIITDGIYGSVMTWQS